MAIEFNCPYCTSTIRVPDDASGKKGTCPRCETPIMVPVVEMQPPSDSAPQQPAVSPPASGPVSPPDAAAAHADLTEKTAGTVPEADPADVQMPEPPAAPTTGSAGVPAFDQPLITPTEPVPSYARALKRKRKKSGMAWIIPMLFGMVLVGIVLFLWLQNRPTLYGELSAERLTEFESASGGIARTEVADLPKEVVNYVLEDLQQNPKRLTSDLIETEFRGTRTGIEVRVYEGQKTAFFRVAPRKNADFDNWVNKHADVLEEPHEKELKAAARRFFEAYDESKGNVPDLAGYRDSLGLNALVSRVGYNMAAVVGEKTYRCVYEDADQRLYFLLPQKTRQFELVGRQLDNGEKLFPGSYEVKVK